MRTVKIGELMKTMAAQCAIVGIVGPQETEFSRMAPYDCGIRGDLVVAPDRKALEKAVETEASVIVIPKNLADQAGTMAQERTFLISAYIPLSHALLKQAYGEHNFRSSGWDRIHSSAVIHESVLVPEGVNIGPGVVIEQGVQIGEGCDIMANCVIQSNAILGKNTRLYPGVVIGWDCEIGEDCLLMPNAVIGGEGFGFAQDQNFNHHRIPQTGKVIIGKKVRIGASSGIDRATYGATRIGDGCIIDNLCHIAHNVVMGKNCIILAGFMCAGSCTIGDRLVASGGAMIKDHVNICDGVYLMHRAGVIKDITQPGMYAGAPVLPMKQYVKSNAVYGSLGELREEVLALKKRIPS